MNMRIIMYTEPWSVKQSRTNRCRYATARYVSRLKIYFFSPLHAWKIPIVSLYFARASLHASFRQRYESNMLDTIVAFIVMQKCPELMLDVEQFGSRLDTIDRTVGPAQNMQIRATSGPSRQKQ